MHKKKAAQGTEYNRWFSYNDLQLQTHNVHHTTYTTQNVHSVSNLSTAYATNRNA